MAILIEHPCVQHKLAIVRNAGTGHKRFRELSKEITQFICYEALKNVKTKEVEVETPVATATCRMIDTDLVVVPILRAGVGMLDGILELVPTARVGFVGLYRDEETKQPVTYYERFPPRSRAVPVSSSTRCWRQAVQPSRRSICSRRTVLKISS